MMLFGGKLLAPPSPDADTVAPKLVDDVQSSAQAQRHALKTLSTQEKLLLVELQKTRSRIVQELASIDPAACGSTDNFLAVNDMRESYEAKIAEAAQPYVRSSSSTMVTTTTHTTPVRRHVKAKGQRPYLLKPIPASPLAVAAGGGPIKLSAFKTGVDMLPIMASTGDSALEVGLRKQGPLQLPVFKLPSLDSSQYKKRVVNGAVVLVKARPPTAPRPGSVRVERRGSVYRDRRAFLRAVAEMHRKLAPAEAALVQRHLRMTPLQVRPLPILSPTPPLPSPPLVSMPAPRRTGHGGVPGLGSRPARPGPGAAGGGGGGAPARGRRRGGGRVGGL